ncbi:Major Facilitator Superfamily protein [Limihaloglobus sulfuriphilus]|uniref:Major Facilitator Superfamily protein n=2 Tax=Limihaloglobus sulfuriphilus TaxID=1851148 RepID=A0A1Q2MES4_9BACT|nr:Major Facilitator Superfamily protein [Limihaloglobus sulfuriphilus]
MHFLLDTFPGSLPVILPALNSHFGLSVKQGVIILSVFNIICNGIQLLVGHLRERQTKPLLIPIGIMMLFLIAVVPAIKTEGSFYPLMLVWSLIALGVGLSHPESMRSLYSIPLIPTPIASAAFVTLGFVGFSAGGWIASGLVSRWGIPGLWAMSVIPIICLVLIYASRLRLATEDSLPAAKPGTAASEHPSIWRITPIVFASASVASIFIGLLPTLLAEKNFALTYGGKAVMLHGIGFGAGSMLWAVIAHKKGELETVALIAFAGFPFYAAYMLLMDWSWAIILLLPAGLLAGSTYPLLVTLCKAARGLKLGQRMGLAVGGAWGIASMMLLLMTFAADFIGLRAALWSVPLLSLAQGIMALGLLRRLRKDVNPVNVEQ